MIIQRLGISPSDPTNLLGKVQSGRFVLQEFVPLADSLEWALGGQYLLRRGGRAFLSDPVPVPYVVNNTGTLSRKVADLFFTAVSASEACGTLPECIAILELGIGIGLFARSFLDAFRDRCDIAGKDYYDRLTYVAADHSERMLLDAVRHGTFQTHPGHYLLRVIDALDPASAVRADPALNGQDTPFVAVFLNYLLDCLPATILHSESPSPTASEGLALTQLCVRTCLARGVRLREYTEYTPDDLARLAASPDSADRERLLDLLGLFTTEYDYQPVRPEDLPYGAFALGFARRHPGTVVHNHGAIICLERLLDFLHPKGFILINDYGSAEGSAEEFEHQRYTGSTFVGVNFALLKDYFESDHDRSTGGEQPTPAPTAEPVRWTEPAEGSGRIFSRMLGHDLHPKIVASFRERFGKPACDHLDEPVQKAKTLAGQGRFEVAASSYRVALERQPWNWLLLGEVANFLTFGLRDPQAGLEVARAALDLNPCCSAELWNAYGDAAFALGRIGLARHTYEQALAVNPDDVAARLNLAWVYLHRKQHAAALRVIAEALARDWRGEYRDRLLQKQAEVLADLALRSREEFQTLLNRVSLYPRPAESPDKAPARPLGYDKQ